MSPARAAPDPLATDELYIVDVQDQCDHRLAGHSGCAYASPPQPAEQALALVRILLGSPRRTLAVTDAPWTTAIVGGQRVIQVHLAEANGRLTM